MKKSILLSLLLSFSLVLAACGNTNNANNEEDLLETPAIDHDEVDSSENEEPNQDESSDTSKEGTVTDKANASTTKEMSSQMDEIDYTEFELEVEYGNDNEFEVELEQKNDGSVKAKIEDEVNNLEKYDEAAFNDLYPLVSQLTITQETAKEEAIQEILTVFGLSDDYKKFEVEIKFKDNTKIEFEDKK